MMKSFIVVTCLLEIQSGYLVDNIILHAKSASNLKISLFSSFKQP